MIWDVELLEKRKSWHEIEIISVVLSEAGGGFKPVSGLYRYLMLIIEDTISQKYPEHFRNVYQEIN